MVELTPEQQAKRAQIRRISDEVAAEVMRATEMFNSMEGPHEAYGVIAEEFWDEVKKYNPRKNRDTRPAMRTELIQLAAMSVRAVLDEGTNRERLEKELGGLLAVVAIMAEAGDIDTQRVVDASSEKLQNPRKNRDTRPAMRTELIQLAAMSVRAVLDVIDNGKHYEAQP